MYAKKGKSITLGLGQFTICCDYLKVSVIPYYLKTINQNVFKTIIETKKFKLIDSSGFTIKGNQCYFSSIDGTLNIKGAITLDLKGQSIKPSSLIINQDTRIITYMLKKKRIETKVGDNPP